MSRRPGKLNTLRGVFGFETKEDYLLRPLINAIRDLPEYKHPSSTVQLHYDRNYIIPLKEQSELLKQEIENNPNLQSESENFFIRSKILEISNDKDLLIFFSKKERDIPYTSYKNKNGEIVKMDNNSIYNKLMNIQTYYNNSFDKIKNDEENRKKAEQEEKNRKENELRARLQQHIRLDSYGRQLMEDIYWVEIIVNMEYFINREKNDRQNYNGIEGYSDKEYKINDYVKILNQKCSNNEFKKIAEEIIIRLCRENGLNYGEGEGIRNIPKIITDDNDTNNTNTNNNYSRNTNTNNNYSRNTNTQNTNINLNTEDLFPNDKQYTSNITINEINRGCPSKGYKPVPLTEENTYRKQSLLFHPDRNKDCVESATAKMKKLNELRGLSGGKKRSIRKGRKSHRVKRRKSSRRVKRRNTKRRYRK